LLSRRSIRRFREDPVPDELIEKALDIARFAPSAHNNQPWVFVVVKDKEKLRKLAEIHRWSKPILGSQLAIIVFSDSKISPRSHLVDGSIVATYLWLALHCLGLSTVWIYTLERAEQIRNSQCPRTPHASSYFPRRLSSRIPAAASKKTAKRDSQN